MCILGRAVVSLTTITWELEEGEGQTECRHFDQGGQLHRQGLSPYRGSKTVGYIHTRLVLQAAGRLAH